MISRLRIPIILFLLPLFLASAARAQDLPGQLLSRVSKGRAVLDALPTSDFVKAESQGPRAQLGDVEAQVQAKRTHIGLETLSSAAPGIDGLAAAANGWVGPGKGIDALEKEWTAAGQGIERDRKKFPARAIAGQSAFVRAVAELSIGQVSENYAAALEYGRFAGVQSGAYYMGRAQGHLAFALFSAQLADGHQRRALRVPSMAAHVTAADKEIIAAYARPGATTFHSTFISANSSIKLARELEGKGYHAGALVMLLRAVLALGNIERAAPPVSEIPNLRAKAAEYAKQFAADKRDQSIAEQYAQKVEMALEAGSVAGEAGDRQRLRADVLLNVVLPRYLAIIGGGK